MPGTHTVGDVIRQFLPHGSKHRPGSAPDGEPDWSECPEWPPDVFAVVATIVEQSDCYSCIGADIGSPAGLKAQRSWNDEARELGRFWASTLGVPKAVEELWRQLQDHQDKPLHHRNSGSNGKRQNPMRLLDWERLALRLLAVADEAGRGFGWAYPVEPDPDPTVPNLRNRYSSSAARFFLEEFLERVEKKKPPSYLPYLPNSICSLVSPGLACVQPKSNTPQMGCTMRALSHHLALLPSVGIAESEWVVRLTEPLRGEGVEDDPGSLNVLVVPFPYEVHGRDFLVAAAADHQNDGLFSMRQGWLHPMRGRRLSAKLLTAFVVQLIEAAQSEVPRIDIVVFPELALTNNLAEGLAKGLVGHFQTLRSKQKCATWLGPDLLICGTNGDRGNQNLAMTYILDAGLAYGLPQSKHHRWRIDGNQIKSYHLGHAFNPMRRYWEKIPLRERHLRFVVNRNHEVIAALVCEDLARADPVMPLLNAIGPNLVVALLMDGPQLISRWPGRYATVLADDPGAAVLTVTSLGMVKRSRAPDRPMPGDNGRRCVAIWREPDQRAHELDLPDGAHALVLALTSHPARQVALDLRDDADMAFRLELSAVRPIRLTRPPAWLARET